MQDKIPERAPSLSTLNKIGLRIATPMQWDRLFFDGNGLFWDRDRRLPLILEPLHYPPAFPEECYTILILVGSDQTRCGRQADFPAVEAAAYLKGYCKDPFYCCSCLTRYDSEAKRMRSRTGDMYYHPALLCWLGEIYFPLYYLLKDACSL
jgi:hypothetical protein